MDVICDIDGTVADCSHRLHWIQSKPKNWKAFVFLSIFNICPDVDKWVVEIYIHDADAPLKR